MIEIERPRIECEEISDSYGRFVVEPLERGFGTTLGNSLRRVLLSSLPGVANFKDLREQGASKPIPKWLELDSENLTGKIAQMPQRDDIDLTVEENLIVEFYSR